MTETISRTQARNTMARRIAQRSPAEFAIIASGGRWELTPHLALINEKLLQIARGDLKRLMVLLPPRHGKSLLVSQYLPAWYLGMYPDRRVILTSYEADFAAQWGRRARDLLEQYGSKVFPEPVTLHPDSSSASRWDIEGHQGGMMTAGVRGALTGKGMMLGIIDDPVKNAEEANSQVYRDHTWEWYESTFYTRLEPDGAIILIQTRWHEDDLGGRLLERMQAGGEQWTVINLPAIAEDHDQLGRQQGEPLWPERFGKEDFARIRQTVGPYVWDALYQQRPAPPEGELLKKYWWKFYKTPPACEEVIQSWDMAFKDTKNSSRVCGQVWGRSGANAYLLDEICENLDFPGTIRAVISLSAKWPQALKKLVEGKANGPAVIAVLKNKVPGLIEVEPEGSKVARASAVSGLIEAGNAYLPDPSVKPWIHDFIQECSAFPRGKYSDRVDAMSQALARWVMSPVRNTANEPGIHEAVVSGRGDDDGFDFFGRGDELDGIW